MKIDKDVELEGVCLPSLDDSPYTGGRPYAYPFFKMEIGDSFEMEGDIRPNLYSAAKYHGRKFGKRFVVRKTPNGARCWRVK